MKQGALIVLSALMLTVFAGLFSSCGKDSEPDNRPPWEYAAVYYMGKEDKFSSISNAEQDFDVELTLSRQTDKFEDAVIIEPNQYPAEFYQWKPVAMSIYKGAVYEWENDNEIEQVGEGKWKWGKYTLERITRNDDGVSILKVHIPENQGYTMREIHIDLGIEADTENGIESIEGKLFRYEGVGVDIKQYPQEPY